MKKYLKMMIAVVVCLSVISTSAVIPVAASDTASVDTLSLGDGTTNLALNKAASASSYEGTAGRYADAAVDGDSSTRWASAAGKDGSGIDETWFQVDLGSETEINKVVISWESRPNKFKMQISADGTTWEDVGDIVDNGYLDAGGNKKVNTIEFEAETAKYVRMQGIQRRRAEDSDGNTGYSIYEFEVYGPAWSDEKFVNAFLETLNVPDRLGRNYALVLSDDTYGVDVSWESSDTNVITIEDGTAVVHRTEQEQTATLTATIKRNEATEMKTFEVVVPSNVANEYNIYPVPQEMTYRDAGMDAGEDINIIYEAGVNEYTKAHLESVLENNQYSYTVNTEINDSKTNLLVGIYNDEEDETVDNYFETASYSPENSVIKGEGYVLDVNNSKNIIAVMGHDNTGASYGLSTLDQMLEQSEGCLKEVTIEDYPETTFRGYIEGFYGTPWSHENRMDLMEFCGKYKMNTYIYGPKNDPYHASQWRDPYPDDQLAELKELVDKGKETNVEFVWAIHVGGKIDLGSADDIQKVKDKFDQLYGIGVRQFAVFFDDSATDNTQLVAFMNDLQQNYVEAKGDVKPLIFCPQYYNKLHAIQRGGEGYLRNLRNFDEDIQIMWTGDYVVSEINQSVIDYITNLIGRDVYIWWNYPVNDLGRASLLHMGPTDALSPNIKNMSGLVSNPMNQAQCDKVSLFSIANYTWNSTKYDSQTSWEDSWERIITDDKEALEAFKIFVQNCASAPMSFGNVDESVYLQPYFEAFNKKYYAGEDYSEEADALISKLAEIKDSIVVLRNYQGTNNIAGEMSQWMDVMYDIADAGEQTLTALLNAAPVSKDDNQSIEDTMNLIQTGRTLLDKSNNGHGGKKCAQKHLYPFVETLLDNEEKALYEALGFEIPQEMFGSSKTDYSNAMDNDNTTYVGLGGQAKESYFGIDLGKVTKVSDISVQMNEMNGSNYAYYKTGVLEYSTDKITWTTIGKYDTPVVESDDCGFEARFIRYRAEEIFEDPATGFNQSDIQLIEMSVNDKEEAIIYTNSDESAAAIAKVKKDYYLTTTDLTLQKDEYSGIEFTQVKTITNTSGKPDGLTLQYSLDAETWEEVPDSAYYKIQAKYIRLINANDDPCTFNASLKVHAGGEVTITNAEITNASAYSGSAANMYDDSESSGYWLKGGTDRDLNITLAEAVPVYDLYIYNDVGRDYISQGTVYISSDNTEWTEVQELSGGSAQNLITLEGQVAQYIKITIKDTGWIKVNDIKVNTTVPENVSVVEGDANAANINDMRLFTGYNTGANAGNAIYKTMNLTNENSLKFLKSNNSSLCVEGLLNGEWEEIGAYTNMYNEIYFEEPYEQFRFSWDENSNVNLYEVAAYYADADRTALQEYYESVKDTDSSLYAADTWSKFEEALTQANNVLNTEYITQSAVDQALTDLEKTYTELEYKDADYTKVDEAIAKANALDKENYKDFSAVEAAIKAVVRGKDITEQDAVDAMAKAIEDAIDGLQEIEIPIELPYEDVNENDWFYSYVYDVYVKELMTGLEETVFGPNNNLVRAQFAVIIYRMEGEPEVTFKNKFPDVKNGQFYSKAVIWAAENGIVTGYTNSGLFGPNDLITREQMATMMFRYANYKKLDTSAREKLSSFPDGNNVQNFATDAVKWCVAEGIIAGKGEEGAKILDPQGNTVRAECATIISRYTEIDK